MRISGANAYDPGTHSAGWIIFNGIEAGADWHWDKVHSNSRGQQVVLATVPAGAYTPEIGCRQDGGRIDGALITSAD